MRNGLVLLGLLVLGLLGACGRAPAPSPAPVAVAGDTVVAEEVVAAAPDSALAPPSAPAPAPAPEADGPQTLSARFVEIQMGDYAHLVVRDAAGRRHSFFLADELPYSAWADLDTLPGMKGKQLELTWRHVRKYLDAAGGTEEIDEVTAIRYR